MQQQYRTPLVAVILVLLSAALSMPTSGTALAQDAATATALPTVIPPTLPPAPPMPTLSGATAAPTSSGQVAPTRTPRPTADRTAAPTARPDEQRDSCEGNDTPKNACGLPLDAISGPYTFVPEGDLDYYGIDLGATPGQMLTVFVRATSGLDVLTAITRADTGAVVGTIESPAISTTLPADLTGWLRLRLEHRGAGLSSGQSYRIELRRQAAAAASQVSTSQEAGSVGGAGLATGADPLENNWSLDTAAPIAVGTAYELNFVCPDPHTNACYGGDHDYLRVTVKAGTPYLITTYDLAPGVDTVLDLFWGNRDQPLTGSDDAAPTKAFLSVLRWVAPADGEAIIRVAPRTGGLTPIMPNGETSSYKLAVAVAGSELAQQLEATIAAQTFAPTPTPTATVVPTPSELPVHSDPPVAAPAAPIAPTALPQRAISAGRAVVVDEVQMTTAPANAGDLLATLPVESIVTLTGESTGIWVLVTTATSVVPGWVDSRHLLRAADLPPAPVPTSTSQGAGAVGTAGNISPALGATPSPGTVPAAGSGSGAQVTELLPLPPALPPALPQRTSLAVTVQVVQATEGATTPLDALRVQVVNAFGDLIAEGETQRGRVTLTLDLVPGTALRVRLPAVGIDLALDPRQPDLTITIPGGAV